MKIVYIVPTLRIGGTENQLVLLAGGLRRAGYDVVICCLYSQGECAKIAEQTGIRYFFLNAGSPFDISIPFKLYRLIKREMPDIVHTFLFDANTWGPPIAKFAGAKYVISGRRNYDDWMRYPHLALQKIANRFTDSITVNSSKVKEFVVGQEKALSESVKVIYNGLDAAEFDKRFTAVDSLKMKEAFGIKPGTRVVVTVANLKPSKGLEYLIKAAARVLANKAYSVCFLIIGHGPLRQHLEQMAGRLGIADNVVFTGLRQDIPEILFCADLAVNSSIREGMSNAVLEYMAAGLPVIATNAGGNAEAVRDGLEGYIVPSRDAASLTDKIEALLKNESLARQMGKAGRKRVEELFSARKMIQAYGEFYERAIKTYRS